MSFPSFRRGRPHRAPALTPAPALDAHAVLCRQLAARSAVDAVRLHLRDGDFLDRPVVTLRARSDAGPVRASGVVAAAADTGRIVSTGDGGDEPLRAALAVPLHGLGGLVGVLELLRREAPFTHDDVARVRVLARPIARTIERGMAPRRPGPLRGRVIVPGKARGPLSVYPHAEIARRLRSRARLFPSALAAIGAELDAVRRRLRDNVCLSMRPPLTELGELLRGGELAHVPADATALDRATAGRPDLADLALLAAARAAGVDVSMRASVLATRRMSSVLALAAAGAEVIGCVIAGVVDPLGLPATVLHAAHLPSVSGVEVERDDALADLDANAGLVSLVQGVL